MSTAPAAVGSYLSGESVLVEAGSHNQIVFIVLSLSFVVSVDEATTFFPICDNPLKTTNTKYFNIFCWSWNEDCQQSRSKDELSSYLINRKLC